MINTPQKLTVVATFLVLSMASLADTSLRGKQTLAQQIKLYSQGAAADKSMRASTSSERDELAKEELGYAVGLQAYIYGLPSLRLEEFRYSSVRLAELLHNNGIMTFNDSVRDGVQYNEWLHVRELQSAKVKSGGSPNVDTLYSTAFYQLATGPLVLSVPAINDRYYTIQFVDSNLSNVAYIGIRTTGADAGRYLLAGPDWEGTPAEGIELLRLPTNEGFMAMRILVDGPDDLKNVTDLQDRFDLQPLQKQQEHTETSNVMAIVPPDKTGELSSYRRIVELAQRNPPKDSGTLSLWQSLAYIGLFLDKPFIPESIDPAIKRGMSRAESTAADILAWKVKNRGYKSRNFWSVDDRGGRFQQDYLARAESAVQGFIVHDPEEAMVFQAYHDGQGELLNGSEGYTLHFKADYLPPVEAFWSITVYTSSFNLVDNPIDRYSIGDRTEGLRYNDDGSLTLYIQPTRPEMGDSNWLPTPLGDTYRLNFRMYQPQPVMLDKTLQDYYLPPLVKIHQ